MTATCRGPGRGATTPTSSYEFEPEPAALLAALLPRYISARIFSALLESAASESAARRRAMKSASDNATELIKTYTRLANQARQAEITQEISEIVGGADALAAAGSDETMTTLFDKTRDHEAAHRYRPRRPGDRPRRRRRVRPRHDPGALSTR